MGTIIVSIYMVWYRKERERKKRNGSSPVERGISEEMKAVGNGLKWVACHSGLW